MKGYLRKGATLVALKNYSQAQAAYEKALELHPNHPVSAFESVSLNTLYSVEDSGFWKHAFGCYSQLKIVNIIRKL